MLRAGCVTGICLVSPPPVTVIVPCLHIPPVFAAALILKEPLPIRFAGDISDMVSHDTSLLCTLQVVLEVTLIVLRSADAEAFHVVEGFNVSVAGAAAWVTEMVRLGTPGAVTVTVPVLGAVLVLAAALILNEPSPVRFAGVTFENVSHATLLEMPQVMLEVTLIVLLVACDEAFHAVDGFNVSVGGAPAWLT